MRIVYTNLQENDSGVKRSVRQLRVEFNQADNSQAQSAEDEFQSEGRHKGTLLPSDSALFHRRRSPSGLYSAFPVRKPGTTGQPVGSSEETGMLCQQETPDTGGIGQLTNLFIKKFLANIAVCNGVSRGTINITV